MHGDAGYGIYPPLTNSLDPAPSPLQTTKGAPHIILKLVEDAPEVAHAVEAKVQELGERGIRALAVAKSNPVEGGTFITKWCWVVVSFC